MTNLLLMQCRFDEVLCAAADGIVNAGTWSR